MNYIIAAEHFTLTPAIRSRVSENVEKLSRLLDRHARVRVFAKLGDHHEFSVLLRILWRGREWVVEEAGAELYAALTVAREKAYRIIARDKRRIYRRRAPRIRGDDTVAA